MNVETPTAERLLKSPSRRVETIHAGHYRTDMEPEQPIFILHRTGKLGQGDTARIRLAAAEEMRRLFHSAGLEPQMIGNYMGGSSRTADHADAMPDHEAWNRALYNALLWDIDPRPGSTLAKVTQDLCCFDRFHPRNLVQCLEGLDRVAKLRCLV